jgi:hypothetical protein
MRRPVVIGLYVVFLVLLAEAFGQIAVRVLTGRWPLTDGGGQNADMFEAHPYLVGAPRPGAAVQRGAVRISINRLGYRGPEITPLPDPGVLRVLALGGSTTFGNYVDDADIWTAQLEKELTTAMAAARTPYRRVEVVNAAVPGFTSAENLIQLELLGVHLRPQIVILFQGLNDLRNAHSPGLRPDYANFHALTQRGNLELDRLRRGNRSGLIRLSREVVERVFTARRRAVPWGERSGTPDSAAAAVFGSNLRSFAGICRAHALKCLFVPQVVTQAFPVDQWWLLYAVPDSVGSALARYNRVMNETAASTGTLFAAAVTEHTWEARDFRDYCHFSPVGHATFAQVLLPFVMRLAQDAR